MCNFLKIKIKNGVKFILPSNILFIEASNKHSLIYCIDFNKIEAKHPLKWFELQLDEPCFFRIHNSFIINCHYLQSIHDHRVKLLGDKFVPISRYKRKPFEENLDKYYNKIEKLSITP